MQWRVIKINREVRICRYCHREACYTALVEILYPNDVSHFMNCCQRCMAVPSNSLRPRMT